MHLADSRSAPHIQDHRPGYRVAREKVSRRDRRRGGDVLVMNHDKSQGPTSHGIITSRPHGVEIRRICGKGQAARTAPALPSCGNRREHRRGASETGVDQTTGCGAHRLDRGWRRARALTGDGGRSGADGAPCIMSRDISRRQSAQCQLEVVASAGAGACIDKRPSSDQKRADMRPRGS